MHSKKIIGAVEISSSDMSVMSIRQELRQLRRTVQMDELTGIGNRRYLEGRLHAVIAELEHQTSMSVGLLFIDIDHFKQFNDTYGHNVGDKVLRIVAATLKHNLRKSDVVGRWGRGIPGHPIRCGIFRSVKIGSEKLRGLVEYSRLDLAATSLSVTISVGATLLRPTDTPESTIRRADELMYQSKQAGRNKVSVSLPAIQFVEQVS